MFCAAYAPLLLPPLLLPLEVLCLSPVGRFHLRPMTFDFQTFDPLLPHFNFLLSTFSFYLSSPLLVLKSQWPTHHIYRLP
jgi:hypothetical protein